MFRRNTVVAAGVTTLLYCLPSAAAESPVIIREGERTIILQADPLAEPPISPARRRAGPGRDARHCLNLPTTTAVIKCAEKYL